MTELIELLTQQSKTRREHVYTEADTRAVLIDPLLDVLGWRQEDIRREPYDGWPEEKGYLDYLIRLNARPFMVVEAKKTGRTFDIPESLAKQGATTLKKLRKTGSKDLTEALDQCIKYAGHCGAPYSCATNGLDYIFFKPNHIGRDQLSAKVVVFRGIDNVLSGIDNFEKLFKKSLVEGGTAEQILVGRETQIAEFCRRLNDDIAKPASQNIESQDFSYILDQIVRNFILELKNEEMFDKCYVRVPWVRTTNDAFEAILRNQLVSQESREEHRGAATVNRIADETMNSCEVGGRTIVVHGPIGIGKTSFLRQLPKTLLKGRSEKLAQTLQWMHIDLLDFFNRKFNAENYSELTEVVPRSWTAC